MKIFEQVIVTKDIRHTGFFEWCCFEPTVVDGFDYFYRPDHFQWYEPFLPHKFPPGTKLRITVEQLEEG